ncbi:PREDICTED: ESF1 homolog [Dufourea novaeangliae]|uniref:ESF1 like protein n=1 Tax=Dufourea novaeangliae TaxID=178035 RepID=A0A154P2P6_DUFNO|nr:PREDICTED: ESF1 homolog [Dufourea novaeangliae]KZC06127.1 ESF1 like protein [Dufourea novaeangliae]
MDPLLSDKRFAYIAKDPKFKRIPKAERKIKIDKRFQGMFKDKKFTVHYTIDKRGRPISQTSAENLKKYYDLSSSEEEEDKEVAEEEVVEKKATTLKSKQQGKKEKSKSKQKKDKHLEEFKSQDVNSIKKDVDDEHKDEDDNSSDNHFSSNGELLRLKPKEEYSEDSEEHSESKNESESESAVDDEINADILKSDLKESKKQLRIERKNESNKLTDKIKEKLRDLSVNYARGEGVLMTDSSSDDDSSDVSDEEEIDHNWGELDKEAHTTDEITHRLAVCNMDWDRIRAVDLMVLFNSFLPNGGVIRSIAIYPSEFGLQRMKEEEISGPKELIEISKERDMDDENDDEEGSAYHMEKLRQYQLNRLKYYYAVADFDSAETANKIYTECDGTEYESTATKMDLRFIPNDMEFDQAPREVCSETPELSKYQPRQFTTTALQQVKVELTWDETNPERLEIAQKLNSGKLDEINANDLQTYLATDSSDEETEAEEAKEKQESQDNTADSDTTINGDPIEKYKALLKEIEEKEESKQKKDVELEFTWGLGTKEKAEKLVKEKMKKDESLTPFEQYLEKRKAKKKAKRDERKKRKDVDEDASSNSEVSDLNASASDDETTNNKSPSRRKKKTMKNSSTVLSEDDADDEEKRKAELELLLMDETEIGDKRHFNMKKIEENATMTKSKRKRLSKKKNGQNQIEEDNFEVNVQDPRFNALFTSHHYNIDPADPHYRKTKGTESLVQEKLKRRANNDPADESTTKQQKMKPNAELEALVKSVKRNTKNISRSIK